MATALPRLAPRNEWDSHFKDVHGLLDELLRRIGKLEDRGTVVSSAAARRQVSNAEKSWPHSTELASQLVEVHRKCRDDLATKQALQATASRMDLDMAKRSDLEEGLEGLRDFARSEVAALRVELTKELDTQRNGLLAADKEIRGLDAALKRAAAHSEATYVTKAAHQVACERQRKERDTLCAALRATLEDLDSTKASRRELADSHAALQAAHASVAADHSGTAEALAKATGALRELERHVDEDLATLSSMQAAQSAIAELQRRAGEAEEVRRELHTVLEAERAEGAEHSEKLRDHGTQLASWMRNHNSLSDTVNSVRGELKTRCDKLREDLTDLDRREHGSWDHYTTGRS